MPGSSDSNAALNENMGFELHKQKRPPLQIAYLLNMAQELRLE